MDLKLHRPHGTCALTGRPFAAGEAFYSALVRGKGALDRLDIAAEAWGGPPDQTLAWWKSAYPTAEAAGPALAPVDVLLDVLEELDGRPDDEPLRYLLALQLVRRRVLKVVEDPAARPAGDDLTLACRKRDREYHVRAVPPQEVAAAGVEERLTALLWSGGAA
jgi:hypothetical protein